MKLADIAILVLNLQTCMIQQQELIITNAVVQERQSLVVAANKLDMVVEDSSWDVE